MYAEPKRHPGTERDKSQIPGIFPIGKRLAIDSDRRDNLRGALRHSKILAGAHCAVAETGGGGGNGIRTGRAFRAFRFRALVVIEGTHETSDAFLQGGFNVQHVA
jgi:hypothetical protein